MYVLKTEINDLEAKFNELDLAIGINWLMYDDKIQEFFAIWKKITQHYQHSSDTFIHPLVIYIYKMYVVNIRTTIDSETLDTSKFKKILSYRNEVEDYIDIILEHTTTFARDLVEENLESVNNASKTKKSHSDYRRTKPKQDDFLD